jgi:iron complex transport system substrate-binding protein
MGTNDRTEALIDRYRRNFESIRDHAARAAGASKPRAYIELGQGGRGDSRQFLSAQQPVGALLRAPRRAECRDGTHPGRLRPDPGRGGSGLRPAIHLHRRVVLGEPAEGGPHGLRPSLPETTRANLAPYAQRPGWAGLSAIRAGELHALEHGLARTLFDDTALLYMAKRFYPGAFEGDDPVASLADYHTRFLPVSFSGTWMLPWRG